MEALRRFDRGLAAAMQALAVACFVALFLVVAANIVGRFTAVFSVGWLGEVVEGLFAWLVFIGAAAIWREHGHFRVEWLETVLPDGWPRRALGIAIDLVSVAFLAVMTWQGWLLTLRAGATTPMLSLPVALFYAAIPVAGAIMIAYTLADIVRALVGRPTAGHRPLGDL